ncbi:MAG: glycosyltransferase family 2 protein [bacterium]|nr:glycosyltransferase family 2 protein [bacterium]
MLEQAELSVIIVTWNSESEIGECIKSVIKFSAGIRTEIIVVDNRSSDSTLRVLQGFPEIKIIANKENTGFTKGCNEGIRNSSGKNILLLNPDTVLKEDSITSLIKKLNSNETTGGIAPQLLNPDGSVQMSCRTFPTYWDMFCEFTLLSYIFPKSRTFAQWKMNYFDHKSEREVDQPMAAALMIKREVISKTGNFDERFEMFFNDVDLCKGIYDNGYRIIFFPDAKVLHEKGVSIYKERVKMIRVWNNDCMKYFEKHYNNTLAIAWLNVSLRLSGFFRIIIFKITR